MTTWLERLKKGIKAVFAEYKTYFTDAKGEIAFNNLTMLKNAGLIGLVLLPLFFILTPQLMPAWKVTGEYISLVPVMAGAALFGILYGKFGKNNYAVIQTACVCFLLGMFGGFIALSVFPYPKDPQIFITLGIMVASVLFIMPPLLYLIITALVAVIYIVLAISFKTPSIVPNDLFATIASFCFSLAIMVLVFQLRLRDYNARANYYKLSREDGLTGVLNKATSESLMVEYLQSRNEGETCAFIVLDVDNFKNINDTFGHQTGDKELKHISNSIKTVFNGNDVIGRMGGDEFCILMKNVSERLIVEQKAKELNERIAVDSIKSINACVTCSIGIAITSKKSINFEELLRAADRSMYRTKANGKDSFLIEEL